MLKKINSYVRMVSVLTLVAFLNLTAGCSTNKNISFEEVKKKTGRKIRTVILPKVIEGVQLLNGDEIIFEGNGAIYNRDKTLISGLSANGDSLHYDLHDLEYILVTRMGHEVSQKLLVSVHAFLFDAETNPWKTINGRSICSGELIKFDKSGGAVDIERNLISGMMKNGKYVEFKIDEIFSASTKEFDVASTLVAVGLSFLFLVLNAMFERSFSD